MAYIVSVSIISTQMYTSGGHKTLEVLIGAHTLNLSVSTQMHIEKWLK